MQRKVKQGNSPRHGEKLHLASLRLQNFRSFTAEEIPLCSDLTIFVGENNGGKSNAVDAIRLLTAPMSGRRDLYCETTDIRFAERVRRFELQATYSGLSPAQQGRLLSAATDATLETAVFGLTYDETKRSLPARPTTWCGRLRGVPEPGSADMIRHVYLPPLRDAKRALASGNPTRIYALLRHFLGDEDPDELAKRLRRNASDDILLRVGGAVEVGLSALTVGVRRQAASLGFDADERLIDIARDLRFKLADHGIVPEDLRYSGHGYANLLYMATIAVELEKVNNADLTIFLVEEPEAHLHPQLQAAVLSFLQEHASTSREPKGDHDGPAGELQVVVATHSPNLSAWVEGKKLVVFKSVLEAASTAAAPVPDADPVGEGIVAGDEVDVPGPTKEATGAERDRGKGDGAGEGIGAVEGAEGAAHAQAALPVRRVSRCLPLNALGLPAADWRKVDRYLDVTKSALLFGGRVLLVEGIAEALLLPVLAKTHVLKGKPDALRLFRSAVFVPIDGVDFEPYVHLLLAPLKEVRVADRVVVLTDGDTGNVEPGEQSPGSLRKHKLDALAVRLGASDAFLTVLNTYSLETELVVAGNAALMRSVFLALHPRSGAKWDSAVAKSGREQAQAIQALFEWTPKGDFAQLLADRIAEGSDFEVPAYLRDAIEAVAR